MGIVDRHLKFVLSNVETEVQLNLLQLCVIRGIQDNFVIPQNICMYMTL